MQADDTEGWNLFLATEGFEWAPESASGEHVDGLGHAHLYIDGIKTARLYGAAYHLTRLEPGSHEIRATLNGNDHAEYETGDATVKTTATIEVEGTPTIFAIDHVIDITVAGGRITPPPERMSVNLGDTVLVGVTSDVADEVHLHGYDISSDVDAGHDAEILFEATIPGIFEVELESAQLKLIDLTVR